MHTADHNVTVILQSLKNVFLVIKRRFSFYEVQWRSQTWAHLGLGSGVSVQKTVEHRTFVA